MLDFKWTSNVPLSVTALSEHFVSQFCNGRGRIVRKARRSGEDESDWFEPIIWTGYYTGMRRGEILNLRKSQVRLDQRIVYFGSGDQVKDAKPKRVPRHAGLIPILERCLRVSSLSADHASLMKDSRGIPPVNKEAAKSAWRRMLDALDLSEEPNFHNLRHTFKANCRRSLIPESISERILGHADADGMWTGHFKVSSRYGDISDQELVEAIDRLTFNHCDRTINGRPVEIKTAKKNVSK